MNRTLKFDVMKKIYFLLLFAAAGLHAQIPNSGFENALGYGGENVADWGQPFSFPVWIDLETGESHAHEITFGDQLLGMFCSSVADAHSGEKAMLIRNAFNITTNAVIPGKVSLFNSEISETATGWNAGIPVGADTDIQFLSFWYKFAPAANDVAEATLELFNADSQSIGLAKISISEPAEVYTYASTPLVLTGIEGAPAFVHIEFSMAPEGSVPAFGSSLTIDDLKVNPNQLRTQAFDQAPFTIWPTIAGNEINILKNGDDSSVHEFTIIDIQGKIVSEQRLKPNNGIASKIDIGALSSGLYLLRSADGFTAKFIKK